MRARLSLSAQAAAGIALVVTLVFVWGLGRVGSELDTAQSNALAHEAALSRVLAAQLTSVVGLLHRASVTAARLPSFWDADDTGRDALLAAMTDNALLFDSLAYVAEDLHEHGRSTYSGEAPRLDFSSSPYVREVAATGAPAFGDMTVMPDSNPSVPIVPITVPIHEPT